jgi:hypothetical protein
MITLDEKLLTASMRAEFRLKQTLERLEWEEGILKPAVETLRHAATTPGKERIVSFSYEGKIKPKTR